MPKNTTQIIFECSEEFRRRLQQEKLKRGTSVKQMIMEALESYWLWPADKSPGDIITFELNPYDTSEKRHWADMLVEYLERCPPEKVQLLQRVIEEDLKVYRGRKKAKKLVVDAEKPQMGTNETRARLRNANAPVKMRKPQTRKERT